MTESEARYLDQAQKYLEAGLRNADDFAQMRDYVRNASLCLSRALAVGDRSQPPRIYVENERAVVMLEGSEKAQRIEIRIQKDASE